MSHLAVIFLYIHVKVTNQFKNGTDEDHGAYCKGVKVQQIGDYKLICKFL